MGYTITSVHEGWVFLSLQNFHLMLGHCPDETPADETRNHAYFAYVNCSKIDELFLKYQDTDLGFTQVLEDKPWGQREFGVRTPEGHRIMFGQSIVKNK